MNFVVTYDELVAAKQGSLTQLRRVISLDNTKKPVSQVNLYEYPHSPPDLYWMDGMTVHLYRVRPCFREGETLLLTAVHTPHNGAIDTLPVFLTDIWLQRLRHISEDDMHLSGIRVNNHGKDNDRDYLRVAYRLRWDATNAEGYRWRDNPWVWVYQFTLEIPE